MDNRALLAGGGLGAALALTLDPDRGARRRALIRDKFVRGTRTSVRAADATIKDMAHRTQGIWSEARGWVASEAVDDARLVERVRAKLGRVCSHPRAIDVDARAGEITLRGPILAAEMADVIATVE